MHPFTRDQSSGAADVLAERHLSPAVWPKCSQMCRY